LKTLEVQVAQIARLNKLIKIQEDNPKWKLKQKKSNEKKSGGKS